LREPSTTPASAITIILLAHIRFLPLLAEKFSWETIGHARSSYSFDRSTAIPGPRDVRAKQTAVACGLPRMRAEDDHDAWILYSLI
jgi:hypothetical protein